MTVLPTASSPEMVTKQEFVARQVREAIVAGRLAPGERIRQQQLANDLGVSPTPVREALRRLVSEGWLILTPHIGVSVASLDHAAVDEAYRLRALLEGELAAEAARRITPQRLAEIREVNAGIKRAARAKDWSTSRQLNFQFHTLVWETAESPIAVGILNALWAQMPWGPMSAVKDRHTRTIVEHAQVVDALATGNPETAKEALVAHINSGRHDYHEHYSETVATKAAGA
jgi:DNA-binding GntR family transcriptional regulator